MSRIVLALVPSLALVCSAQNLLQSEHEKSLVQIYVQKPDNTRSPKGTGFFVSDDGLVATALHVYSEALKEIVDNRGGAIAAGRASRATNSFSWAGVNLVSTDAVHDLALLKLAVVDQKVWSAVGGIHPLKLAHEKEISPESPVTVVGYFGSDLFPVTLDGYIAGETVFAPQPGVAVGEFLVSVFAAPGESGSPVLLSNGTVVGLITAMVPVSVGFNTQPLHS